jgi:hypothetical protein
MTSTKLECWKQIAFYLQCSESTAWKWARLRGMPVHRLPGGRRFALSNELDAWRLSDLAPAWPLTDPVPAPGATGRVITVRLPEDVLTTVRPLIGQRFSTMQEFVRRAVTHYAEQQLRA